MSLRGDGAMGLPSCCGAWTGCESLLPVCLHIVRLALMCASGRSSLRTRITCEGRCGAAAARQGRLHGRRAGALPLAPQPTTPFSPAHRPPAPPPPARFVMNTNLTSAFHLSQLCYPVLKASGDGLVLMMSSVAGGPTAMRCGSGVRPGVRARAPTAPQPSCRGRMACKRCVVLHTRLWHARSPVPLPSRTQLGGAVRHEQGGDEPPCEEHDLRVGQGRHPCHQRGPMVHGDAAGGTGAQQLGWLPVGWLPARGQTGGAGVPARTRMAASAGAAAAAAAVEAAPIVLPSPPRCWTTHPTARRCWSARPWGAWASQRRWHALWPSCAAPLQATCPAAPCPWTAVTASWASTGGRPCRERSEGQRWMPRALG